ncbi:unnamed protein product [Linum trigynum]|uniref:Uncharacterized protein n=1 Tax=Linum trigynum TaxID=586398 RepID=A0AAV2E199_9ROSI
MKNHHQKIDELVVEFEGDSEQAATSKRLLVSQGRCRDQELGTPTPESTTTNCQFASLESGFVSPESGFFKFSGVENSWDVIGNESGKFKAWEWLESILGTNSISKV